MKTHLRIAIALLIGGVIGAAISTLLFSSRGMNEHKQVDNQTAKGTKGSSQQREPLYWVAPMDPNFRRDKPGKSPMGMDLIPFYGNQRGADESMSAQAGSVKISPDVVNNLGVRTAQAKMTTLNNTIETVGYIKYNEDTIVHMHPRVEGWVDALYVSTAGETVSKGQKMYGIYSPQLVSAQEEYLLAKKGKSRVIIDAARQRLLALHMPQEAMQQLDSDGKVLQSVTFYAPQSGVLEHLKIRHGFYVKPGDTLLSIASLDEVWVEAEVFEQQASLLEEGLAVNMDVAYLPDRQWQGKLDYIYPSLDISTRALRVRLRFDNPERLLKPNMYSNITIQGKPSAATLTVPREAVIRTGNQDRVVLALGEGYFKSVAVTLGKMSREAIEITSGIEMGDEVVTSAQFLIDSQSSISSDFVRMDHDNGSASTRQNNNSMQAHMKMSMDMESKSQSKKQNVKTAPEQAQVRGTVNSINIEQRSANISRGPIEKWGRGPATMVFSFAEHIDEHVLHQLNANSRIEFTFEISDGDFVIVALSIIDEGAS
ncbi:Cation efflux system protein CusB [Paraglaciecola mesophila]|uniref:Cation efflux system protein CusB n=1 Tax=Paraglaciecola mesophila TaxID=197222 RepID=A0A857JDH0_9ALTE|nr:efflux RND transporter periplasmic adaptor subunit [Paraglaciecola mesophila]QHJ10073.1 Cation efflux system protein CusB [Paraglaciecola mesophila]